MSKKHMLKSVSVRVRPKGQMNKITKKTIVQIRSGVNQIKKFDWNRIIFPFTTYYKKKYGRIYFLPTILDLLILVIPFSTIIVVLLVKFVLNDVD